MGVCGRRVPMRGVCGRARVWAKNDSSVVWFVNLGVSWLNFRELSVVDSGFVFDISY